MPAMSAAEREAVQACESAAQAIQGGQPGEKDGELEMGEAEGAAEGETDAAAESRKRGAERGKPKETDRQAMPPPPTPAPPPASPSSSAAGPRELVPNFKLAGGQLPINPWEREKEMGGRTAEKAWAMYENAKSEGWMGNAIAWTELKERAIGIPLPGGVTMSVGDLMEVTKWAMSTGCVRKMSADRTTVQFADMLYPSGWKKDEERSDPSSQASSTAASPASKTQRGGKGKWSLSLGGRKGR